MKFQPPTLLSFALLPLVAAATDVRADDAPFLREIVVSASASEQSLRDAPAAMSLIDRDDLLERPVRDVLDAVRESAGITMSSAGFTRKQINIRGMDSGHTLFLVDGRRVNASADVIAHSDFELGWIPTEAIRQVEVVRGPMSALYGSEALGGVINVLTRPVTDTWTGSSSLSYGQPAGSGGADTQAGAYLAGPLIPDQLGLRLFADFSDREETPDDNDPALSAMEGRRALSGGGTLSWTPAQMHRIDLSFQQAEDERRRNTRTGGPPHLAEDYEFRDEVTRRQIDVHYNGEFEHFQLEAGAYRSTLDRENFRTAGTPSSPQRLDDDIVEGRLRFDAGRHDMLLGGEYRREQLDDGSLVQTGSESANRQAVYVQDRIDLPLPELTATLGLRVDNHEQFSTAYSPRAYLVWHASDDLTLRGGYSEGFKAPTLKQLSTQFLTSAAGGRFMIGGNPDLEPETSRSGEFGVLYQLPELRLEATVFENRLQDLVETFCFESCGIRGQEQRTYRNVAEARIRGLETGAGVDLPLGFDFSLNYTYMDTRDHETDLQLQERPRHSGSARLGWARDSWSAQLRAQRIGSQVTTVGPQRQTLPHYTLWHLGGAYELSSRVTLRLGVENLLDERLHERSDQFGYEERRRFAYFSTNLSF